MGLYLCQIETFTFSILLIVFWISWQFSSISRWFYLPMPALHDFICADTTTIKPFLLCGVGIRRHCGWLVDFSFFKSWRLLPWPSHFSQVSSPCVLLNLPLFILFILLWIVQLLDDPLMAPGKMLHGSRTIVAHLNDMVCCVLKGLSMFYLFFQLSKCIFFLIYTPYAFLVEC